MSFGVLCTSGHCISNTVSYCRAGKSVEGGNQEGQEIAGPFL